MYSVLLLSMRIIQKLFSYCWLDLILFFFSALFLSYSSPLLLLVAFALYILSDSSKKIWCSTPNFFMAVRKIINSWLPLKSGSGTLIDVRCNVPFYHQFCTKNFSCFFQLPTFEYGWFPKQTVVRIDIFLGRSIILLSKISIDAYIDDVAFPLAILNGNLP